MASLADVISQPERRKAVVADAEKVVDLEVGDKSGLSGFAIKGGFALVKGLKPGIIGELVEGLLPEFCGAVDPILAKRPPGNTDIAGFLNGRSSEVIQSLLGVTDARAKKSTHASLVKMYEKLRPTAEKNVAAAIPRLAGLIERHLKPLEKT
jgi:hypothetical protein